MFTGRDAAHKRIADMLAKGEELPVEFRAASSIMSAVIRRRGNRRPRHSTTATRMDKFMT